MGQISVIRGNIFRSRCQTIVNTVNCVGVMGAGLAFECRLRWPGMYLQYRRLCAEQRLRIGLLWLYKAPERWILNFPTKQHWKFPSKAAYLQAGLEKFVSTHERKAIVSAAFPLLGAQNGGMDPDESLALMQSYLSRCAIPIEIYQYDPAASDDVFDGFKAAFLAAAEDELKCRTGLRANALHHVQDALHDPAICQMSQLLGAPGIGEKTLEKCFGFAAGATREDLASNPGVPQQALPL